MSKSNDQLVKLAELMGKSENFENEEDVDIDDVYDKMTLVSSKEEGSE